jgi:ADP-ribose pyrophosphatase YjhB (NUDIX family)
VPDLHNGHRHLINHVREIHRDSDVLILLGDHGGERTDHDPLTFDERKEMIEQNFPGWNGLKIDRLLDHPWSHDRWAVKTDERIAAHYRSRGAVLYGSRGSGALALYTGKHRRQYVEAVSENSGTLVRTSIRYKHSLDARSAIIFAQCKRHPILYSTVDVAIVDKAQRVLLITKEVYDGKWSFPGGFVDPERDTTDEDAARREGKEEILNITTSDVFTQMGPRVKMDDPRYRDAKDKTATTFFRTEYIGGEAVGGDDAEAGVRWFTREELKSEILVPWHRPLADRLEAYWTGKM